MATVQHQQHGGGGGEEWQGDYSEDDAAVTSQGYSASEEEDEMAGIIADFVAAIENGATVLDDYAPAAHNPVDDGALQVCLCMRATASNKHHTPASLTYAPIPSFTDASKLDRLL